MATAPDSATQRKPSKIKKKGGGASFLNLSPEDREKRILALIGRAAEKGVTRTKIANFLLAKDGVEIDLVRECHDKHVQNLYAQGHYDIEFRSTPLGFSVIMDRFGNNAIVSSIQNKRLINERNPPLQIASKIVAVAGDRIPEKLEHQKILKRISEQPPPDHDTEKEKDENGHDTNVPLKQTNEETGEEEIVYKYETDPFTGKKEKKMINVFSMRFTVPRKMGRKDELDKQTEIEKRRNAWTEENDEEDSEDYSDDDSEEYDDDTDSVYGANGSEPSIGLNHYATQSNMSLSNLDQSGMTAQEIQAELDTRALVAEHRRKKLEQQEEKTAEKGKPFKITNISYFTEEQVLEEEEAMKNEFAKLVALAIGDQMDNPDKVPVVQQQMQNLTHQRRDTQTQVLWQVLKDTQDPSLNKVASHLQPNEQGAAPDADLVQRLQQHVASADQQQLPPSQQQIPPQIQQQMIMQQNRASIMQQQQQQYPAIGPNGAPQTPTTAMLNSFFTDDDMKQDALQRLALNQQNGTPQSDAKEDEQAVAPVSFRIVGGGFEHHDFVGKMQSGTVLYKKTTKNKLVPRWFELSTDFKKLRWYSPRKKKSLKQTTVSLGRIQKIHVGQQAKVDLEDKSTAFTLEYMDRKDEIRELPLVAESQKQAFLWFQAIKICGDASKKSIKLTNQMVNQKLRALLEKKNPSDNRQVVLKLEGKYKDSFVTKKMLNDLNKTAQKYMNDLVDIMQKNADKKGKGGGRITLMEAYEMRKQAAAYDSTDVEFDQNKKSIENSIAQIKTEVTRQRERLTKLSNQVLNLDKNDSEIQDELKAMQIEFLQIGTQLVHMKVKMLALVRFLGRVRI